MILLTILVGVALTQDVVEDNTSSEEEPLPNFFDDFWESLLLLIKQFLEELVKATFPEDVSTMSDMNSTVIENVFEANTTIVPSAN